MRKEFEMSQAQLDAIYDACKPVPYMIVGGMAPRSQQDNANEAWSRLGRELGFEYMSVEPGRSDRHFTADVTEGWTPPIVMPKPERKALVVTDHGISVHVGDDGAWISIKTKAGRSFTFQPVQQWPINGTFGATVSEWASEMQKLYTDIPQ